MAAIMTADAADDNTPPAPEDDTDLPPLQTENSLKSTSQALEALMKVSLAGFGGSLVGLSLSRQSNQQQHLRGPAAKRLRRPDTNLSASWAVTCMAFVGIMEACQWTSLASYVVPDDWPALQSIGDYTIGGGLAGAAFRGMQIQPLGPRPNAPTLTPRILSGLVPGVVLGFAAGLFLYAAHRGMEELNRFEQQHREARLMEERKDESQKDP